MNLAIDILIALVGVAIIIFYTSRGFVRSIFDFAKIICAFFIAKYVVPYAFVTTDPMTELLLYVIVFALVCIILTFIFSLIDKLVKKIPVIRAVNYIMGFFLGVGFAYLFFSVAVLLFKTVDAYAPGGIFGVTEAQLRIQSRLYKFFSECGAFSIFFNH